MRKWLIKNEVLDADFFLVVGSDKECVTFLNMIDPKRGDRWVEDDADDAADVFGNFYRFARINKKYNTKRVIHLMKFGKTLEDIGVLAHEVQHYVNDVCLGKGLKMTRGDEEASAYLAEYTLKSCLKVLGYK